MTNEYRILSNDLAEIKLTRGRWALIDLKSLHRLLQYHWFLVGEDRVATKVNNRVIYMARIILGSQADHINRDPLDNRGSNLRPASQSQNMMNRVGWGNRSRYKGVVPNTKGDKWRGQIRCEGKVYYSSFFNTQEEAALWYNEKAKELHGSFAVLNEIAQ